MFDKLKQEAMQQGMKLMTNPKVLKMLSDPRLVSAISQGFAWKNKMQGEMEKRVRQLAGLLNLATREELDDLRRNIGQMEDSLSRLEQKTGE